jgi:hypothetical protein
MDNNTKNYKFKKSLATGLSGLLGQVASGILYPLELIKIRLQGIYI